MANQLITFTSALFVTFLSPLVHASTYQIIDLGTLGGTSSTALSINASGQIAGYSATSDGGFRAFRYHNGVMTDLGSYDTDRSRGYGINDAGVVVGDDGYSSSVPSGKAWKHDGSMSGISTGYTESNDSIATDINNNGVIVGRNDFPSSNDHAFIYTGGTYLTSLGTLHPDGSTGTSMATAINDAGQVVGWSDAGYGQASRAFIYENGGMSSLGTLGYSSAANDINEAGIAVGSSKASQYGDTNAVIFQNGSVIDIGTLGGNIGNARAINDHGVVVGSSRDVSGNMRAFLFDGTSMLDLNTLLGEDSEWTELIHAYGINNNGDIVGQGLIDGEYHAYLITTVPVPAAMWLMISGLLWLFHIARRDR